MQLDKQYYVWKIKNGHRCVKRKSESLNAILKNIKSFEKYFSIYGILWRKKQLSDFEINGILRRKKKEVEDLKN